MKSQEAAARAASCCLLGICLRENACLPYGVPQSTRGDVAEGPKGPVHGGKVAVSSQSRG